MYDNDEWLINNISGEKGSLIYYLHEVGVLKLDLLGDFYSIAKSINSQLYSSNVDALSVARLYTIHALIFKYFGAHFDPNDGYAIENLSVDLYCDVLDELQDIFDLRKLR